MNMTYPQRMGMAALLSVLGLALAGPLLPNLPASSMKSDWFWSNKVNPGQQFDVVFVGDSRIYRGISPDDFAQALAPEDSLSVFNFGFSSAGMDTAFIAAGARLLSLKASKPLLVLGITTSSLADENLANQHFWQEQRRAPLAKWQRQHLNPHLSYFDPTSPNTLYYQWTGQEVGYHQTHFANGWIASNKYPRNTWETYDHVRRTYPKVLFSQALRQRLLDQVAQLQAQGIQVVAFRPPAAPHLEALEMNPAYYPEAALKAQFQAAGGLWLDLPNRAQYETYDGNHLDAASARQLSKDLGQALRQALALQQQAPLQHLGQDFETHKALNTLIQDPTSPAGPQIQQLTDQAFSFTHEVALQPYLQQPLVLQAQAWVRFPVPPDSLQQPLLVLSVQDSTGTHLWQGQAIREQQLVPTQWSRVALEVPYTPTRRGSTVRAYLWNPQPGAAWCLDGLELSLQSAPQ